MHCIGPQLSMSSKLPLTKPDRSALRAVLDLASKKPVSRPFDSGPAAKHECFVDPRVTGVWRQLAPEEGS
jgi:hypothetical protein